jgi:RNA polymerase sigma factor (sigma-70 family)
VAPAVVDTPTTPMSEWSDPELVRGCLRGDQAAWAGLIQRYKNLIYFFPRRYGAGPADSADVFQLVCAELFASLSQLRDHQCLRSWIMSVAAHQAYHWKRGHIKRAQRETDDPETVTHLLVTQPSNELEEAQRDMEVREAIEQLPPRCRELVRMLFYEDPPVPYQTIANRLGLATGSIGLTRSRCLKKLEQILEMRGQESLVGRQGAAQARELEDMCAVPVRRTSGRSMSARAAN